MFIKPLLCFMYCIKWLSKDGKDFISASKGKGSGNNGSYMKKGNEKITKGIAYVLNDSMREGLQNVYKIIGGSKPLTRKTQTQGNRFASLLDDLFITSNNKPKCPVLYAKKQKLQKDIKQARE